MRIKALGISGGIGDEGHTTAFLLDGDTLIDAGTGACNLPLAVQQGIHQIFLTHAHLDHIVGLPMLAESVLRYRIENNLLPIKVYARTETLNSLHQYILNGHIWPDFTCLPSVTQPTLELVPMEVGDCVTLTDGRCIEAIAALHSVPAMGFAVHQGDDTWLFTGDTGRNPSLWQYVNQLPQQGRRLRWLVTECTFADDYQALADVTGHYTVCSLAQDLGAHLRSGGFELYLSHLKPSDKAAIVQGLDVLHLQVKEKNCQLHLLQQGHVFATEAEQSSADCSGICCSCEAG